MPSLFKTPLFSSLTSSLDSSASAASVRFLRNTYGEIVDGVIGR